ncbi:VasL domain-containing protein [Enterobacter ludwigii]|uniref:VasL domain-containing protein n=1 Tax=Enterobacter ludwigii TaxID=299767 RepID=UPI0030766486
MLQISVKPDVPLEEQLRQLSQQKSDDGIQPILQRNAAEHLNQLIYRYAATRYGGNSNTP